jgi:hypothetical protein
VNNPYLWNKVNLELIYGRKALINEMLGALPSVNGNSFGLTGARRMGKTTVLRAVERDLVQGAEIWRESGTSLATIYIDGLTLPRPLTSGLLWAIIWNQITRHLQNHEVATLSTLEFSEFVANCSSLFSAHELVPKVIVIFDEIEHIIVNDWASAFFANWRALLSNFPGISGYFSAVFSGALEMAGLQHDVGSPLMDVLEWRSLRSLALEDCATLIREPCSLEVSDDCVQFVFDETGGHPMIVQYIMQKSIGRESFSEDAIRSSVTDFYANRFWQFSEWWFKYCDESSQVVYASLPRDGAKKILLVTQELGGYVASKAFEVLQHVGIAVLDTDGTTISRRGKMFSRWQEKNGPVAQTHSFDSGLAQQIESLSPKFREKYVSAWAIYGQDMPNYSGAVSEMRDLITLILHELAPDEQVQAQPNFEFERDQKRPTRRQRILYLFDSEKRSQGRTVVSDDELLESHSIQLATVVSRAYATASALTHTTASRPLAYQALKQGESILAQLLLRGVQRVEK